MKIKNIVDISEADIKAFIQLLKLKKKPKKKPTNTKTDTKKSEVGSFVDSMTGYVDPANSITSPDTH